LPENDIFFIYIWGDKGCGKSHLAEAIQNQNITIIEDIDQASQSKQIDIFNLYNDHKSAHKKNRL
jgi:chromosomal replication initiation ATPase DnaA